MADRRTTGPDLSDVDEAAPDFTSRSSDGELVTLSDLRGHTNVCLFFCRRVPCLIDDEGDAALRSPGHPSTREITEPVTR